MGNWIPDSLKGIVQFPGSPRIGSYITPSPGPSLSVFWIFYVSFLLWHIWVLFCYIVSYRVVFCDIVRQVFLSIFPEYVEIVLLNSVFGPIKSRVDCLRYFLVFSFRWLCFLPLYFPVPPVLVVFGGPSLLGPSSCKLLSESFQTNLQFLLLWLMP